MLSIIIQEYILRPWLFFLSLITKMLIRWKIWWIMIQLWCIVHTTPYTQRLRVSWQGRRGWCLSCSTIVPFRQNVGLENQVSVVWLPSSISLADWTRRWKCSVHIPCTHSLFTCETLIIVAFQKNSDNCFNILVQVKPSPCSCYSANRFCAFR